MMGDESTCFFCGAPKKGFDTTPHRSVMDRAPESMERIKVAVCTSCSQRIHYANIVLDHSEKREGAPAGMMTLEAKRRLCQAARWARVVEGQKPSFVMKSDMVVPSSTTVDGDSVYVGGVKWSTEELRAMQGPMAMKMVGVNREMVAECFWALVVADEATQIIDVEKCKAILEI